MKANSLLSNATNYIQPAQDLNFAFMPKKAIIDFSEIVSPDKFSGLPSWKGIYFPEYQVRFDKTNTDASKQLVLSTTIDKHETLNNSDFWLTNQGLFLNYEL